MSARRSASGVSPPAYAELHCHSNFSFLEGASHPEDLVKHAAGLGLPALAIADRHGLYGAVRFAKAAAEAGLAGVIGAEVHVEDGGTARRRDSETAGPGRLTCSLSRCPAVPPSLVLLVESAAGYAALSRLLTHGQMAGAKGAPRLTWDDLAAAAASGGLLCLSGGWSGLLVSALRAGRRDVAWRRAERLRELFGPGRFWVELQRHQRPDDRRLVAELAELAERLRLGLVATNGVLYADRAARPLQDVLTCIKHHTTLERAGPLLKSNAEYGLKSPGEMAALFPDHPEAIRNTLRIAERCAFRLENVGYRFPAFPVPDGETPFSYLYALCQQGARERYHPIEPRVSKQLAHELELIQKLGLAEYFLIVWDIMRFAKERGILAQGRGSAANSVVAYVLGITNVDPIKLDLLFERFLSEERQGAPDIDVDFANKDREQVIQYVYERYGRAHAGMVCEVISYRPRSAIRDVGKALGLPLAEVDRLAKAADRYQGAECRVQGAGEEYPGANSVGRYGSAGSSAGDPSVGAGLRPALHLSRPALLPRNPAAQHQGGSETRPYRTSNPGLGTWDLGLGTLVQQLQGFPRHLGIHVGGMIVTREPLEEVAPLERATMAGRTVVQWDKDDVEAMGLVKIDLLGLGMLSLLQDAIKLVKQHDDVEIDLAKLGYDDPEIYDMLCRADAVGLFQVESRAQMSTLPRLKPRTFYDLVIEISLIRPGPIQGGSVHPYLRRRAGLEPVTYPHPKLRPVLEKTLGVPLFQEQGMRLAIAAAGFSPGKADQLRRAMGHKRSRERMAELYDDLVSGMHANGIPEDVGQQVWKQLSAFADYGFPESHAASFALLVYASAYLKRYHPAAFYCALLNNQPMGFYPPATIVGDARRHGVRVLPVDVQQSRADCTLEAGALRLGYRYVKGIGESVWPRLDAEAARGPYADLRDFCARTRLDRRQVERLIAVGAFDSVGSASGGRRELLWELPTILEELRAGELPGLATAPASGGPELPETTPLEEANFDYALLGLSPGRHAMEFYRPMLERRGVRTADELPGLGNAGRVKVAGLVICRQAPPTAGGHVFLTLEDETGLANVIVRPDVFLAHRALVRDYPVLEVEGRLQVQDGAISVIARACAPLGMEHLTATVRSRDFR